MARALNAAGCDTIHLEARGIDHTMLEVGTNGKHIEPYKLLFEDDLRRFMHRKAFAGGNEFLTSYPWGRQGCRNRL